jgi:peptide deformylase
MRGVENLRKVGYTAAMDILTHENELLRQKAEPVARIEKEYLQIAQDMIATMTAGKGVGLAGPQVGLMRRIFVLQIDGDKPRVFINPSIIETSQEQSVLEEGCLSLPGLWADVERSAALRVQAWNEKGRPFTLDAEGMLARVILHEYDHLEGILFIDRLPDAKRARLLNQFSRRKKL